MIELFALLVVYTLRLQASVLALAPPEAWAAGVLFMAAIWAIATIQNDLAGRQPRTGRISYAH